MRRAICAAHHQPNLFWYNLLFCCTPTLVFRSFDSTELILVQFALLLYTSSCFSVNRFCCTYFGTICSFVVPLLFVFGHLILLNLFWFNSLSCCTPTFVFRSFDSAELVLVQFALLLYPYFCFSVIRFCLIYFGSIFSFVVPLLLFFGHLILLNLFWYNLLFCSTLTFVIRFC